MSTKSNRSAGTQHTDKGVTQGITLVDPKSGNPVSVIKDDNGKYRVAVDANVTANISGVEVALDGVGATGDNVYLVDNVTGAKFKINPDGSIDANVEVDAADGDNIAISDGVNTAAVDSDNNLHVEIHGNAPNGDDKVIRVSEQGAVNSDGKYDATLNSKPSSSGIIAHDRSATPGETTQNRRITSVSGSDDREALDVAISDGSGNPFTNTNPLPTNLRDSSGAETGTFSNPIFTTSKFEKFFNIVNSSNWMTLATYDQVTPSVVGNIMTLQYKEAGNLIGEAVITFNSDIDFSILLKRYINNDGTDLVEDDDGTPLILE